ncbi:methyltransferase domain-containing protein [Candidatus Albibeggiatoa sp. nov. NOAA]|uniref:SAM-dependent methyltransferase n=1 Tax=Candidatus Albibeggiatoa sp. nov. NOAA TaxID=3162724 RepID=UPI0032FD541B|nr:methyltransferase domain-containing protein [Thiotrichaceae bacterium]
MAEYSEVVETSRNYYNSDDADNFYAAIWGGEDIHIGLYNAPEGDLIYEASRRTVTKLAEQLNLDSSKKVLDIGSGYGGTARYLATTFGCKVDCLNLSEIQNQRNRELTDKAGLSDKVSVTDGSFEAIPFADGEYDAVVSQDAILHSGQRELVVKEVARVLKSGGDFVFTDPMQSDDCPEGVLQPVLDRIHLATLGSIGFYQQAANSAGLETVNTLKMTDQLTNHYSYVLRELEGRHDEMVKVCNLDYVERMKVGLNHWIEAGKKDYLAWGILHFRKS